MPNGTWVLLGWPGSSLPGRRAGTAWRQCGPLCLMPEASPTPPGPPSSRLALLASVMASFPASIAPLRSVRITRG